MLISNDILLILFILMLKNSFFSFILNCQLSKMKIITVISYKEELEKGKIRSEFFI